MKHYLMLCLCLVFVIFSRTIINPSVGLLVCLCVCVCVSVCVLLLISYTIRFGAMVKQRVEKSCYDIPNLWRFSENILVAEKL